MDNVATTLLDYILNLLNDPAAMAAYKTDQDTALNTAGLSGCGEEVNAALASAGTTHSHYFAPADFTWSGLDVDDSFNTIVNESFNDNIVNSFNTNTTINDNDFTNNGVIIDGDGNVVDNRVSDDDTTVINNGGVDTGGGDIVFGDQDNDENDVDGDGNVTNSGDDTNQQGVTGDDNNAQQQVNESEVNIDQSGGDGDGALIDVVDDVAVVAPVQANVGAQDVLSGGRGGDVEGDDSTGGDGGAGIDAL